MVNVQGKAEINTLVRCWIPHTESPQYKSLYIYFPHLRCQLICDTDITVLQNYVIYTLQFGIQIGKFVFCNWAILAHTFVSAEELEALYVSIWQNQNMLYHFKTKKLICNTILSPCRSMQTAPLKHWYPPTWIDTVRNQKTAIWTINTVNTWKIILHQNIPNIICKQPICLRNIQ
jgi:hypothetical protein